MYLAQPPQGTKSEGVVISEGPTIPKERPVIFGFQGLTVEKTGPRETIENKADRCVPGMMQALLG